MSSSNSLFSTTETLGGLNINTGYRTNVKHISAAVALTGGDSGKLLSISQSSEYTITLPDPTTNDGDSFHFIIASLIPGSFNVTISSNAANIVGSTNCFQALAGGIDASSPITTCKFAGPNALGDTLKFISNGTNYILTGNSVIAAGLTTP